MTLLFAPDPPFVQYCRVEHGKFARDKFEFGPNWPDALMSRIGDINELDATGHFLHNGGDHICSSAMRLAADTVSTIENTVPCLPEHNGLTLATTRYFTENAIDVPHFLFCDTGFFSDLPEQASSYALPQELRSRGVKRYGSYGVCHYWVSSKIRRLVGKPAEKLISVYLGDHSNVVAIAAGKPVETTVGFTSIEGILGSTSCGDIDPTIVFQLLSSGMSFEEVNHVLTRKSGFTGLAGTLKDYLGLLTGTDPESRTIRAVLRHQIVSYVGGFVALLGGVDTITFVSENLSKSNGFILEICDALHYLGLKCKTSPCKDNDLCVFSEGLSSPRVFGIGYNSWTAMAELTQAMLNNKEN
jgi:acetate kinase